MRLAVGVTQGFAQGDTVTLMRLDTKGYLARRCQHLRNRCEHRRKVIEIREYVSGKDKMVARLDFCLIGEKSQHFAFDQPIIKTLGARLREHGGRQIDAHHPIAERAERQSGKPGAATKIKHRAEFHPPPGMRGFNRAEQELRRTVVEALRQRPVEIGRIAVKECPHVTFRHGARGRSAKTHKMQGGAVAVLRVGFPCLLESRNGGAAIAKLFTQLTKHEPGRGISRRQLERLRQQISGAGKIALGLTVARPFKAAVGDEIAR